ncbi:MAG: hypothetical protein ACFCGT_19460 [Sandaracinaceae bacterium]
MRRIGEGEGDGPGVEEGPHQAVRQRPPEVPLHPGELVGARRRLRRGRLLDLATPRLHAGRERVPPPLERNPVVGRKERGQGQEALRHRLDLLGRRGLHRGSPLLRGREALRDRHVEALVPDERRQARALLVG